MFQGGYLFLWKTRDGGEENPKDLEEGVQADTLWRVNAAVEIFLQKYSGQVWLPAHIVGI